ncbi:MAG: sensor histidine kinase [Saprospiraceae bacterium]|nr:sensor histidine kinase [Saprospiraceae bacterium]
MIRYTKTFLILFLGLPVMLLGKSLVLTTEKTTYELGGYLETLREEGLTITEARQAAIDGRFASVPTGTPILPFQDYWLRVDLDNQYTYTEGHIEWMLQFSRTWSQVEVYFEDIDGTLKARKSGLFTPVSDRIFKLALRENVVKFNLAEKQQSTLYIRLRSDRVDVPPTLSVQLSPAEEFLKQLKRKRQQNSFFVGFVWMMTLLSILFFFQSWSKVYVFYSMYLIGVSTYASYVEGDLPDYLINLLFPEHPQYIFFVKLIVYLAMVGYLLFLRSFLNLKEMLPRWDKIFNFTIWMSLPLLLLDAFLMMQYNFSSIIPDRVTLSYGIYFAIFNLLFLRSLYLTKDPRTYFIIAGICAMSAGIILMVIARLQSPEFSVAHLELGIIIEILAFTLGLAYRQRLTERERFKAHYELEKSQFIQQQKQAEAQRLREVDELKNRLYTNITHEFRTPLTVIMGMANEIDDERVKKLINRNSENLLRLINQILDLSKLESGKMNLHLVQGDIIAYLQYLTESFLSAAEAKQIRLSFYPEVPTLMMDFDEEKVQLIVYNLLSNAIKFTPNGGKIIFHARIQEIKEGQQLQLKVQDSGPGIPPADLPFIFDRFYQVDNPMVANQGGTGIGLALTKQLIELMGGEIAVSSEEGQGSLFTFFLPITNNEMKLEEDWKP